MLQYISLCDVPCHVLSLFNKCFKKLNGKMLADVTNSVILFCCRVKVYLILLLTELHFRDHYPCVLPHDKTNKMACALSKDSDQPGHAPRLIRVFAGHMKKAWVP